MSEILASALYDLTCIVLYRSDSERALTAASGIMMGLLMESMLRCELAEIQQSKN